MKKKETNITNKTNINDNLKLYQMNKSETKRFEEMISADMKKISVRYGFSMIALIILFVIAITGVVNKSNFLFNLICLIVLMCNISYCNKYRHIKEYKKGYVCTVATVVSFKKGNVLKRYRLNADVSNGNEFQYSPFLKHKQEFDVGERVVFVCPKNRNDIAYAGYVLKK